MPLSANELREIYRQTVVVRRPSYGIVSGYHELPYVCLGTSFELGARTTRIRGRIHVSHRFVIRPSWYEPSYEEMFGAEYVDQSIAGRIFGFLGFQGRPVECKSEHLEVRHLQEDVDRVLNDEIDEIERAEDIQTGVFITPDARYFPVSIERFISSVLEDEFNV